MIRFTRTSRHNPRAYATMLGLSLLLAEALIHAVFGFIAAFESLYILPIWIATRMGKKGAGAIVAVVSAVVTTLLDSRTASEMLLPSLAVRLVSYLIVMFLIDQVETAMERHQRMAMTDPLTGLLNRRALSEHGEKALSSVRRRVDKVTAAMIDCNDFKRLNDVEGHRAGDRVLRILARTLEIGTRTTDLVARVGGDEFAVLLPDTDPVEALAILNRIAAAFEAAAKDAGYHVTLSYGIAAMSEDLGSLDSMLDQADKAMYAHKAVARDHAFLN